MPTYDPGFDPPAPVARVTVVGPSGATRTGVPLLIDTGADTSIVPRTAVDAVEAAVRRSDRVIRFFDGTERACDVAELRIELDRFRLTGRFVVGDAEYGVLGRNFLNQLVAVLNGPELTWTMRPA